MCVNGSNGYSVGRSTRIRDYNVVRFCVKANEANECSVRNQRGKGRGNAAVGGGELELIECTIETCLFVEIKCVHYIVNTHTHTYTRIKHIFIHTNVHMEGKIAIRIV